VVQDICRRCLPKRTPHPELRALLSPKERAPPHAWVAAAALVVLRARYLSVALIHVSSCMLPPRALSRWDTQSAASGRARELSQFAPTAADSDIFLATAFFVLLNGARRPRAGSGERRAGSGSARGRESEFEAGR